MTNQTQPISVRELFSFMEEAIRAPSQASYGNLVIQLQRSNGSAIRELPFHEAQLFRDYLDKLSFHNPPCRRYAFVSQWHLLMDRLIDACVADVDAVDGTREWHMTAMPTLATRIGANGVFWYDPAKKAECLSTCSQLGKLWLSQLKSLCSQPAVVLNYLEFVIVSDGQQDHSKNFPAWHTFLDIPVTTHDGSAYLLGQLFGESNADVKTVCALELDHYKRLSLLAPMLGQKSPQSIAPPSDISP